MQLLEVGKSRSLYGSASGALSVWYQANSLLDWFREANERDYRVKDMKLRLAQLRSQLSTRLDINSLTSATKRERLLLQLAAGLKRSIVEHSRKPQPTAIEEFYLRLVRERGLSARKSEQITRISWELEDAAEAGWYPVFVTLTVRPADYDKVFVRGSDAWRNYYRRVNAAVGRACGLSRREADRADVHRYFAVVERGGRNGRLHIHVLHLVKKLPSHTYDPNRGSVLPSRREIASWKEFWPYGFVSAVAVRWSPNDRFARDGWKWPVVKVGQCWEPYRSKGMLAVARYIGKYLHKTRYHDGGFWRCRKSQAFGARRVREMMSNPKLTIRNLWEIVNCHPPRVKINGRQIPRSLLKREAIREMFRRFPKTMVRLSMHREAALSLMCRLRTRTTYLQTPTIRSTGDFDWLKRLSNQAVVGRNVGGLV